VTAQDTAINPYRQIIWFVPNESTIKDPGQACPSTGVLLGPTRYSTCVASWTYARWLGSFLADVRHEAFRHRRYVVGIGRVNSVAVRTRRASSAAPACPVTEERSINVAFASPAAIVAPRTVFQFCYITIPNRFWNAVIQALANQRVCSLLNIRQI